MKRVLYRIYTEDINHEATVNLVSSRFEGFTVITGWGFWQGKAEATIIFEVEGSETTRIIVEAVANEIKLANHQQSVLVTATPVEVDYI
jgi:hypothetical protein